MKNQFLQVVLEFCRQYELQTEQTNTGDYIWIYAESFIEISALLQSFLIRRFYSVCFDRCLYDEKSIISAKFESFGVCVTSESEVF